MADRTATPYERSVFINCPFDAAYKPVFDTIVFTVLICGFQPRCALEIDDGVSIRLEKIVSLVRLCSLGIHDVSHTALDPGSGLPRFNMPLELGIFLGATRFGTREQRRKRCLVMDIEPYRYQKFMSDISGQDIQVRGPQPADVIDPIRNFLRSAASDPLPGGESIVQTQASFEMALPSILSDARLKTAEVTYVDRVYIISRWLSSIGERV